MEERIKNNLRHPAQLEKLYRENKSDFKHTFMRLFPSVSEDLVAQTWHARLHGENPGLSVGKPNELFVVLILSLASWLIAKTPAFTGLKEDIFYPRNIGFIVFPALCVYFIWKQSILFRKIILPYLLIVLSAAYMNVLPSVTGSDSLLLTFIHFPLCLWSLTGYIYSGADIHNLKGRLLFLRYNGDVIVMATIILLAGGLMTGLTIQLFSFIQLDIKKFYVDYIVVWGLAGAPVIATFLVSNNPQLVARVSPTIAKIFTPLVLVTLVVYLFAMIFNGKDPYQDREFLLVFNAVLVGVLALILFSIAEKSGQQHPTFSLWLLWVLSLVTIVVNGIALSAILFRIHSWGLTANRLAVLGGNVLILLNLLLVSYHLLRSLRRAAPIDTVENSIARYLPVYSIWTMVVAFVFPWVFHFK